MTSAWFTREAYRALELAREEARGLGHGWLGTEHLLLGLIRPADEARGAPAPRILDEHSVTAESVRASVMERLSGSSAAAADGREQPKFTPRMTYVCEHSLQIALELGHQRVGTSHLLLGLLYERNGIGSKVLERLGLTFESVLAAAEQPPTETTETSSPEPSPSRSRSTRHREQLAYRSMRVNWLWGTLPGNCIVRLPSTCGYTH